MYPSAINPYFRITKNHEFTEGAIQMKTKQLHSRNLFTTGKIPQYFCQSISLALIVTLCGCTGLEDQSSTGGWKSLFNGKDLDGWTPKITGHELGDNYANTFRVEDGILKVSYDKYEKFNGKFGHLFYKDKFSHYILRLEYRFVGEQTPGGPGWAFRNSGAMLHCQSPRSMSKDQKFPVCIEAQLLGGDGSNKRSTSNLCTPGTHVVMDDKLIKQHCINSSSKTYHGDQWVTAIFEVHGSESIKHIIDGQIVLEYKLPQLDENNADAKKLIKDGDNLLSQGYISLQAESHPVEFKTIEILVLKK